MKPLKQAFASVSALATLAVTQVAYACPMCFSGGNSNSKAFVWGSLFMMVTPVTALGTLIYLAVKRMKIIDEKNAAGLEPRVAIPSATPIAEQASAPTSSSLIKQV